MSDGSPIYVTRPDLPDLSELAIYLETIWKNKILTNGGPLHQQLEAEVAKYLGVEHLSLFSNGTIALVVALRALELSGEIITTPYSFVATSHALMWNNIKPVFVDINSDDFNINVESIERLITERTTAILPVHVYGRPCDCEKLEAIAEKHKLKLIFDAAHAFGIRSKGKNIFNYGDLSVLSFHATKVFNTFEGGAIVSKNIELKKKIDSLKNFGFMDEETVTDIGINGKMNELSAAIGLLQLKKIDENIQKRKQVDTIYRNELRTVEGISLPKISDELIYNYSYFPIIVDDAYKLNRNELYDRLKQNNIFSRKYFYPLISDFQIYKSTLTEQIDKLPVATEVANKILCLPIYSDLQKDQQEKIVHIIRSA